jgi:hypothetical protein
MAFGWRGANTARISASNDGIGPATRRPLTGAGWNAASWDGSAGAG